MVGSIEICSCRNCSEILIGADLRITGEIIYKTGSGSSYQGWQIEREVWESGIGMNRCIISPTDDGVYAAGAKGSAACGRRDGPKIGERNTPFSADIAKWQPGRGRWGRCRVGKACDVYVERPTFIICSIRVSSNYRTRKWRRIWPLRRQ